MKEIWRDLCQKHFNTFDEAIGGLPVVVELVTDTVKGIYQRKLDSGYIEVIPLRLVGITIHYGSLCGQIGVIVEMLHEAEIEYEKPI